ncbi:DUF421 domain-containing protein [Stakelama sp. CBK3Z-3]|uniref:DUF421 domain-containing protein n=1 Tax=Stakelama flava TaxID=2860338 RepID=A0ABS6XMN2_9SPHN|nr:YetF domain-containing protein [Stakelama flava]MBW4331469.1 DUF421 domain-containing protein [Stakelama flava]
MFGLYPIADSVVRAILLSLIGIAWIASLVRLFGLRTLTKMTAIDLLVTLATASLLAQMIASSSWHAFIQSTLGAGMLTVWQFVYAKLRRSTGMRAALENQPRLLMRNGQFLDDVLTDARVSRSDVIAKLREHNIAEYEKVDAVVLEVTGDIAVLSGHGKAADHMLQDVANI